MAKGRESVAESISGVLDIVRSYRGSGWLRATNSPESFDEGVLYISAGEPVYARLGNLTGSLALSHLLSWRNISFSFTSDPRGPAPNLPSAQTYRPASGPLRPSSAPSGSLAPGWQNNNSMQDLANMRLPAGRLPSTGNLSAPAPVTDPHHKSAPQREIPPAKPNYSFNADELVPKKVEKATHLLALPQARRHRFIYFLVDGRRTIGHIAHCTNRSVNEVELILSELQAQGLIFY